MSCGDRQNGINLAVVVITLLKIPKKNFQLEQYFASSYPLFFNFLTYSILLECIWKSMRSMKEHITVFLQMWHH